MITYMLTLTIANADDNDKENDSIYNESDNDSDNGCDNNNNNYNDYNNNNNKKKNNGDDDEKFQLLTFAINTSNVKKHFATVRSIKCDCKRIPLDQFSF